MIKITLSVEGMMCKMCEAHVNDAINKTFSDVKVSSSHQNNQTVVLTKNNIDIDALKQVIVSEGYKVGEIVVEEQKKKGLFSFLKK